VRAYGEWGRDEARRRIGKHYPQATLDDGTSATVIAWIWARTVTCPNPACGIEMPLTSKWWLSKKKGQEAWVRPHIVADPRQTSGKRVQFEIVREAAGPEIAPSKNRQGATCVACGAAVTQDAIKAQGQAGNIGNTLMGVVAEGNRRRVYLAPSAEHVTAARIDPPDGCPEQELGYDPRNLWTPPYGLSRFSDLFSNRQLVALTSFSDVVVETRERVLRDAVAAGAPVGSRLEAGGDGAQAYADAVATYLSMVLARATDRNNTLCTWDSGPTGAKSSTGGSARTASVRNAFARQAIPMTWDFAECNPFSDSGGSLESQMTWVLPTLQFLGNPKVPGAAAQSDALHALDNGGLLSTDPPYYDNIGYADLSDFFYVWHRRTLREVWPELLSTMLVPKAEELVANPYRHDGKEGARAFFEAGFRRVFSQARDTALDDFPITVFYAFKQSDSGGDEIASMGWETMLDAMIRSGWVITATWPMRSELSNRMLGQGTNTLASSIALALRPRPGDAPTTDRRGLIAALHDELPDALRKLQQGTIAPVDLPQAAIGPGMAVFSRYAKVIENDGTTMTVRSALARINEILDQVLNEQEGDFDPASRFAIGWYRQYGYATGKFGVADDLARARNTAVETLVRDGILTSAAGKVTLLSPAVLPDDYDVLDDDRVGIWEALHHLIAVLDRDGLQTAGAFLARAHERPDGAIDFELVKELAFLLFSIAEKNGWTHDALAFNTVATAWPEIVQASRAAQDDAGEQAAFAFEEG
jgi:putative DNA methylase